ncbi:hypothetical protein TNCV_1658851 [Trichonephila clavipes]|nr:hypothetical protein TNCV_1658851 [Trichonephila clavipes]
MEDRKPACRKILCHSGEMVTCLPHQGRLKVCGKGAQGLGGGLVSFSTEARLSPPNPHWLNSLHCNLSSPVVTASQSAKQQKGLTVTAPSMGCDARNKYRKYGC